MRFLLYLGLYSLYRKFTNFPYLVASGLKIPCYFFGVVTIILFKYDPYRFWKVESGVGIFLIVVHDLWYDPCFVKQKLSLIEQTQCVLNGTPSFLICEYFEVVSNCRIS